MIKIAFLFSTLEGFGLVKIILALVKELKKTQLFDIHVITLSPEPKNSLCSEFQKEGISIHCLNMSRIEGMFYAKRKLIHLTSELQIDIIHSNGFRANLIHSQVKHQTKSKAVMTIHLDPNDDAKHPLGMLFRIWRNKKHISIIKRNEHTLACSRSIAEALTKYGIHIPFIQNGIEIILPESIKPIDIREQFNIPKDHAIFVILSGLHKRKNISHLIRVFNDLGKDYPLLIIGDGPDRKELEAMANKENIFFLGYKRDAVNYLSNCDIYLSASSSEGLPLSVMEAMSMGNVPVLSNIPPHIELIENTCFLDYIFDYQDKEKIATICKKLSQCDLQSQKEKAINLISTHFSAKRMTEEYISLYKSIL